MIKAYRKLLAVLLVLTISIGFGVVNAENDAETAANEKAEVQLKSETEVASAESISPQTQKMMNVLKIFKIIPEYYDYNVPLGSEVSRSDFAASVARMMGKTTYSGQVVYFYDVPKNYWAYNEISNLAEMGILSGTGDKVFNPGEPITKSAAYTMLLCAMGYRGYAENLGGYPTGYTTVASRIKLSQGVSGSEMVTLSDMLNILYNALTVNIAELNFSTLDAMTYEASDETLISSYRNIYYGEGVVNGANCITTSGGAINKDYTLIDNLSYKSEGFNMIDYLGEKVEFFYEKEDLKDEKNLLWIEHKSTSQNIKNISIEGSANFDTDTFIYTGYDKDGKKNKITFDRSLLLVYNGGIVESGYDTILNNSGNRKYDLKLISSGGKYTVAIVREYKNYIVGNINSIDCKIYDKNNPTDFVNLKEEDYDTFSIKLMGRDEMSFEDIEKDAVLTVYQSEHHIEVYVSYNLVNGVITQIEKNDYTEVTINDNKYRVDDNVLYGSYGTGDSVTAYTNIYGEVVYIAVKNSDFEGAFLLEAKLDRREENLYIKLLGEDSKVVKLKCAEKVIIDGEKCKEAKKAYTTILSGGTKLTAQFALIRKNGNGEIREIDTTMTVETPNSLQIDVPFNYDALSTIRATSNAARIGEKIVFDENTKMFIMPKKDDYDNVKDEKFWVTVGSKIVNDTGAYAQSYKTSEDSGVAKYVILQEYDPSRANAETPILVQKIFYGLDDWGNTVEVLKGYQGNAPVNIKADESESNLFSAAGVSPGDVVTLKKDAYGNVEKCTIRYDYSEGTLDVQSKYTDAEGVFVGYANSVVDNVLKIGYANGGDFDFAINVMSNPVLIFDKEEVKEPISVGTVGDIITYKNSTAKCSKVLISTNKMQPKMFVVYR